MFAVEDRVGGTEHQLATGVAAQSGSVRVNSDIDGARQFRCFWQKSMSANRRRVNHRLRPDLAGTAGPIERARADRRYARGVGRAGRAVHRARPREPANHRPPGPERCRPRNRSRRSRPIFSWWSSWRRLPGCAAKLSRRRLMRGIINWTRPRFKREGGRPAHPTTPFPYGERQAAGRSWLRRAVGRQRSSAVQSVPDFEN